MVVDRDDRVPKSIPERIELFFGGKRIALRPGGSSRYGGEAPGKERRFGARLPAVTKRTSFELRDPAPAGSEPLRFTLSVDPPLAVVASPPARVVTTARSKTVSLAEVYPAPGGGVTFELEPAAGDPAPPKTEPAASDRRDSHMSHTPRHDGTFFMAQDGFHHLEGVAACGAFTLYVYDDRILPLPVRAITGRLEFPDGTKVTLRPDRDASVLVAPLPKSVKAPFDVVLFAGLAPGFPEFRFDFGFRFVDPCPK